MTLDVTRIAVRASGSTKWPGTRLRFEPSKFGARPCSRGTKSRPPGCPRAQTDFSCYGDLKHQPHRASYRSPIGRFRFRRPCPWLVAPRGLKGGRDCRCCGPKRATQIVFGEAPPDADLVLVGEQPGDKTSPATLLSLRPVGSSASWPVSRQNCYLTNAVKDFKHEQRGKRRLHARPNAGELQRCGWWFGAELPSSARMRSSHLARPPRRHCSGGRSRSCAIAGAR